ncbi:MAG: hypothetical protein PHV68_06295 [Candidatus Gastranaerophilales bacterium]|nr:hypothetical protein [Candidatus Gastranaerophilales bacterium]
MSIQPSAMYNTKLPEAYAFVTTPDDELKKAAKLSAYTELANNPTRKVNDIVYHAIPVADSFATAAKSNGSFATKTMRGADRLTDWIAFIITQKLIGGALRKLDEKSPKFREARENHPIVNFVASVGVMLTAGLAAMMGKQAVQAKVLPKILTPERTKKLIKTINKIPGTKVFNEKVYKPVGSILKNNKWIGTAVNLGLVGLIVKNIFDVNDAHKKAEQNYVELKEAQRDVAVGMVDELLDERV